MPISTVTFVFKSRSPLSGRIYRRSESVAKAFHDENRKLQPMLLRVGRSETPVLTGYLRSTEFTRFYQTTNTRSRSVLLERAYYGIYVRKGTRNQTANPYDDRTAERMDGELAKAADRALRRGKSMKG